MRAWKLAAFGRARSHGKRSANRRKKRPFLKEIKEDSEKSPVKAPIARKKAYIRRVHGREWNDPYHWMSNARDPCVCRHLALENLYVDSAMASTKSLQCQLRKEMTCRVVGDEASPPELWGPWLYYARIPAGQDYPVYLRRRSDRSQLSWFQQLTNRVSKFLKQTANQIDEQKLLDINALVKENGFAHLGVCKVSKDHRLLAYTIDFFGKEICSLFVKDIETGALLSRQVAKGVVSVEWARDNRSLLYTRIDKMLRPFRLVENVLE